MIGPTVAVDCITGDSSIAETKVAVDENIEAHKATEATLAIHF